MLKRDLVVSVLSLCAVASVMTGCEDSSNSVAPDEVDTREGEALTEFGDIYRDFIARKGRPPKNMPDFETYGLAGANGYEYLKRGEILFSWGITPSDTPEASTKILAYESVAPNQGGLVLMQDCKTVKKMSAEEFKAAPKASGR